MAPPAAACAHAYPPCVHARHPCTCTHPTPMRARTPPSRRTSGVSASILFLYSSHATPFLVAVFCVNVRLRESVGQQRRWGCSHPVCHALLQALDRSNARRATALTGCRAQHTKSLQEPARQAHRGIVVCLGACYEQQGPGRGGFLKRLTLIASLAKNFMTSHTGGVLIIRLTTCDITFSPVCVVVAMRCAVLQE